MFKVYNLMGFDMSETTATITMMNTSITSNSFLMLLQNFHPHSHLLATTELLSDPMDGFAFSRILCKRTHAAQLFEIYHVVCISISSFLLLITTPLYGYTTVYQFTY